MMISRLFNRLTSRSIRLSAVTRSHRLGGGGVFTYEHGSADENRLDLYDGAVSLGGISRATTITTHALINGEIRKQGHSAVGAKFFLRPSKGGSFLFEATIYLTGVCSSGLFYDFFKYAFRESVGKLDELFDPPRASVQKRIEPTIGVLPAILENSLMDIHRPVRQNPEMTISIQKPRGETLARFDQETGILILTAYNCLIG